MPSTTRAGRGALISTAVGLAVAIIMATAGPGWTKGGAVLPATAKPHGYSLTEMTVAVAPFTTSGNDPASYPDTPFQILFAAEVEFELVGTGVLGTGTNSFSVPTGTPFFVPIFNVNDLPPVLGVFPTTKAQAIPYFFGQSHYGGDDFEVIVDGVSTPIGAKYLSGPVDVAGFAGTHIITLGAFLHPLSPGSHEVRVRGGIFGDLVDDTYGVTFVQEELTYTVEVVPGG